MQELSHLALPYAVDRGLAPFIVKLTLTVQPWSRQSSKQFLEISVAVAPFSWGVGIAQLSSSGIYNAYRAETRLKAPQESTHG